MKFNFGSQLLIDIKGNEFIWIAAYIYLGLFRIDTIRSIWISTTFEHIFFMCPLKQKVG